MLYFQVCQSHSFVIVFPLRTFAAMKKFLSLIIAVACISTTTAQAQFYTVGNSKHRYKVKILAPYTEKEAPHHRDTSSVNMLPTVSTVLASKTPEQQFPNKFSLSSPLQSIYITSPFGYRKDPFTAKSKFHNGIDLRANYELCYAMLDGIVERIGSDKRSGNFITLRSGNYTISYCHLSQIIVTKGMFVKAGTPIALTGNSGRSTAPHLHLTVKYKRKAINAQVLLDYIIQHK
jgi:murein DD-endopeptidase